MSAAIAGRDRRGDGAFVRAIDGKVLLSCNPASLYPKEIPVDLSGIHTAADLFPVLLDLSRKDWFTRRHLSGFLKAVALAKGWPA